MTDDDLMALFESLDMEPGTHWQLAKIDGRTEIVVSLPGMRILAQHAPDQDKARALMAAIEERFPDQ